MSLTFQIVDHFTRTDFDSYALLVIADTFQCAGRIQNFCAHPLVLQTTCPHSSARPNCGGKLDICLAPGTLKVIDFGLSKRYLDEQGRVIPKREGRAGFRGSTAYASIYAHEEMEQGTVFQLCIGSFICLTKSTCPSRASNLGRLPSSMAHVYRVIFSP